MTNMIETLKSKSMVIAARHDAGNDYIVEQANRLGDCSRMRLTIIDGDVTAIKTICYRNEGNEATREQLAAMDAEFEPFTLDSYVGAIFFDAAFG